MFESLFRGRERMSALYGFGLGVVSTNAQGATLDAFIHAPSPM